MTTRQTKKSQQAAQEPFVLPDIPEKDPDDMTSAKHLSETGNHHYLLQHLGDRENTIVSGERYITMSPGSDMRYPDLMVAFGANPAAYERGNGYIISQQGKPPDFVLEIASRSSGTIDTTVKRDWYAGLKVPEYWRFDETGEFHGTRLAGDRLVEGGYEPITIETVEEGVLQGYSAILNLFIRWENGQLRWHDPATGQQIPTLQQEREARLREEEARLAAEARVRQLEEELARRDAGL